MSKASGKDAQATECPFRPGDASKAGSESKKSKPVKEEDLVPIPQPPPHWFTRNMPEINPAFPSSSSWRLNAMYGDIVKLDLVDHTDVIISSYELAKECYDESRFDKNVEGPLKEARILIGDGLFSGYSDEHNWEKAHRILMPAFGPLSIRKMFPQMQDMISQMVLRWDRLGPDNEIVLAFDTIAICAFSYRFNSFYRDTTHPFAQQMAEALIETGKRANRSNIETSLRVYSAAEYEKTKESMWKLADDLIAERKKNPKPDVHDVLNAMLNVSDPETGEKMSDENIRFNMLTFLIAGHETTSGTLAFLFYNFLHKPETLYKCQAEVDRVLGDDILQPSHIPQLKYVRASIFESLRFLGPITQTRHHAKEDTVIGGKYKITKDMNVRVNLPGMHHDTRVYGEDAAEFSPERMMDGGFEALPPNAWKAFGNGKRSCIGRFLAEQEMVMTVATVLQRFEVSMADPSYNLHLKSTLTVKPADFKIKVSRRPGRGPYTGIPGSVPSSMMQGVHEKQPKSGGKKVESSGARNPLLILYGSNAGTCKYIAEDLQTMAKERGLGPEVKTLDASTGELPTDKPVVIVVPSYEGKPPDNARKFHAWIESLGPGALKNVKFAVFGVGNSEWSNTFHKVPKFFSEAIPKLGGKAVIEPGLVDVKEDIIGTWEDWRDNLLDSIGDEKHPGQAPELAIKFKKADMASKLAGEEVSEAVVKKNVEIAPAGDVGSAKRHMEVELPEGVSYEAGDYLVIMPTNPPNVVRRAARRFKLNMDDSIEISGTSKEFLTGGGAVNVVDLLAARVELGTPASRRHVEAIARTANSADQKALMELASNQNKFNQEVIAKRRSVLDLLEDYPSSKLPFEQFLDMMKPLAPRQYSISSSPLASEMEGQKGAKGEQQQPPKNVIASITYDVHEAPARSGHGRQFEGVASTYMARHEPGSKIRCYVRHSNTGFHLPTNAEVPIIMICAGTGLAPFRGFVQERACVLEASHDDKKLAPAVLYYGCRDAQRDFLYRDELTRWEKMGAVSLRPAFSRVGQKGEGACRYASDRVWEDREYLRALFRDQGAKIYVCGSASKLAKSATDMFIKTYREAHPDKSEKQARDWLEEIREVRYVSDVFD
ncbi:hypothetical protein LQW54_005402 [Pestalotiopsis sp. IQ-011]